MAQRKRKELRAEILKKWRRFRFDPEFRQKCYDEADRKMSDKKWDRADHR